MNSGLWRRGYPLSWFSCLLKNHESYAFLRFKNFSDILNRKHTGFVSKIKESDSFRLFWRDKKFRRQGDSAAYSLNSANEPTLQLGELRIQRVGRDRLSEGSQKGLQKNGSMECGQFHVVSILGVIHEVDALTCKHQHRFSNVNCGLNLCASQA